MACIPHTIKLFTQGVGVITRINWSLIWCQLLHLKEASDSCSASQRAFICSSDILMLWIIYGFMQKTHRMPAFPCPWWDLPPIRHQSSPPGSLLGWWSTSDNEVFAVVWGCFPVFILWSMRFSPFLFDSWVFGQAVGLCENVHRSRHLINTNGNDNLDWGW